MAWIAAILPGLWVASLLAALGGILSRRFDAVPARVWLTLGVLLAVLFAPVLLAGRVLFPVRLLNSFLPTDSAPGGPTNGLYGDLVLQILPWLTRVRADYAAGAWPLSNPYAGAGEPLWSNPQTQALQPLAWLALVFPALQAFGVLAALRVAGALLFTFLWLRRLGLNERPALAGGVCFALGGYLQGWLSWPLASAAVYLPLLLYALLRVEQCRGRRDVALLAAAGFGLLATGHPETTLYVVLFAGAFVLFRIRLWSVEERARGAKQIALAAILAVSCAAPLILPAVPALAGSMRSRALAERHEELQGASGESAAGPGWSQAGKRVAVLLAPLACGDGFRGGYWGDRNVINDTAGFTGSLAWLLALVAVFATGAVERRPGERLLIATAALCCLILARSPGLGRLFDLLPVLRSSASFHSRTSLLLNLSVSALAAVALQRFEEGTLARRRIVLLAAAAVAVGLSLYIVLSNPMAPAGVRAARAEIAIAQGLAIVVGVLILLRRQARARSWAPWSLLLLILAAEPMLVRWPWNANAVRAEMPPSSPILNAVARRAGRFERVVGRGRILRANLAGLYELRDPRLDNPGKPASYVEALSRINEGAESPQDRFVHPEDPLYGLLGVRFVLAEPGENLPAPLVLVRRFRSASLFERPGALAPLFLPASVEACSGASWSACTAGATDFAERSWVDPATLASADWRADSPTVPEALKMSSWEHAALAADVRLDERRLLGSSVFQDGGWRVLVDGEPQATGLANGPFVAAWLPAGAHHLELLYRPPGFVAGALLAALALAGALAWAAAPLVPSSRE